jgi:hypothetical protein
MWLTLLQLLLATRTLCRLLRTHGGGLGSTLLHTSALWSLSSLSSCYLVAIPERVVVLDLLLVAYHPLHSLDSFNFKVLADPSSMVQSRSSYGAAVPDTHHASSVRTRPNVGDRSVTEFSLACLSRTRRAFHLAMSFSPIVPGLQRLDRDRSRNVVT